MQVVQKCYIYTPNPTTANLVFRVAEALPQMKIQMKKHLAALCFLGLIFPALQAQKTPHDLHLTQQTFTVAGPTGPEGSLPLGNGDVTLNVWVSRTGELCLLVGKADAYDENSSLLKPGLLRMGFLPAPFQSDTNIQLTFHPDESVVTGRLSDQINVRIRVDANHPVIVVETEGAMQTTATIDTWRKAATNMAETQVSDLFKNLQGADPYATITFPDTVVTTLPDLLAVFHQNIQPTNDPYLINLQVQGIADFATTSTHPLLGRTFGVATGSADFAKTTPTTLQANGTGKHTLLAACLTLHPSSGREWVAAALDTLAAFGRLSPSKSEEAHADWWRNFWNNSFVDIASTQPDDAAQVQQLSRAYTYCRYLNGAAGRGSLPIKFNGSAFSYGRPGDYDYRRWGGPGFWYQNQRLVYWPMLAQGDFNLMNAWFEMSRKALPLQLFRTKRFFGHEGAFFPETATFWGAEVTGHYGWTPFEQRKNKSAECTYITYYWQNGIEQLLMMCEFYNYTLDKEFLTKTLLPHAEAVTLFYDLHYQLDNRGKIHFGPASSLETYHVAVNPLPEIAGLRYTLTALLNLPASNLPANLKKRCQNLLKQLPELPSEGQGDQMYLLPAQTFEMKMNVENPELYAVFPYRLFGVGKPDLQTGKNTFARRLNKWDYCWGQNAVDAALLGLTDTAARFVLNRASATQFNQSLFPAFWNQNNDWIPDVDHGGVLQLALNCMLLQCEGDEIRLLPAWPRHWDVTFKLHAPGRTTIECSYKQGKITRLEVWPPARAKDIIIPEWIKK